MSMFSSYSKCIVAALLTAGICVSMCACGVKSDVPDGYSPAHSELSDSATKDIHSIYTLSEKESETESSDEESSKKTASENASSNSSASSSSSAVSSAASSKTSSTSSKTNSSASKLNSSSSKTSSTSSKETESKSAGSSSVTVPTTANTSTEEENTAAVSSSAAAASSQTQTPKTASSTITVQQPVIVQEAEQPTQPEQPSESEEQTQPEVVEFTVPEQERPDRNDGRKIIVIDAGHQSQANLETEPLGPGSPESKIKVSGGTQGRTTGLPEYELTLILALKLQPILEERGYEVIQIRTTNDVNISNSERAAVANEAPADAFIRIHANGSDNSYTSGAMTLCQTPYNPFNGDLYGESRALSDYVLDELVAATGCKKEYVWETDTMSGINWAQVPVTIVEVGYMTNPQEDVLLSQDDYQNKICEGIANGIDLFMGE